MVKIYILRKDGLIQKYNVKNVKRYIKIGKFKGRNLYVKELPPKILPPEKAKELPPKFVQKFVKKLYKVLTVTGNLDYTESRTRLEIDVHVTKVYKKDIDVAQEVEKIKDYIFGRIASAFNDAIAYAVYKNCEYEYRTVEEDEAHEDEYFAYRDYRTEVWVEF